MHKIHPTCAPNRSNSELAVYDRGHRIEVSANNTVLPIEVSMSNAPSLSGNADLASLFECPVCFDFALPPIMQCPSGHIVCTVCRSQLTSCPTCRGPLDNIRNLAMEKLAANVLFPCKYISNGCTETLSYSQKPNHEESCAYRPYSCPCPGASCKWFGALDQVLQHLLIQHKSITTLHGEDIVFLATDINLPGAVDWVMMQSCFGYNFMLVLEKQDRHVVLGSGNTAATSVPTTGSNQLNTATVGPLGHSAGSHINSRRILTRNNNGSSSSSHHHMVVPGNTQIQQFYAIVQLIGTHKQAEQFIYRLELSAPRRRLTWEATPRSIHDGVQTAISCSDCLVFDSNVANIFADNGNLGINVTINQICPSSSPITKSPASQ